jgi:hypothetical protein
MNTAKFSPKLLSSILSSMKPRKNGEPDRVFIIGTQGAGKSCLIGGLAICGDATSSSALTVTPLDSNSSKYVGDLSRSLRQGSWPKANTTTDLCRIDVDFEGRTFELLLLDYPGEDFRRAILDMDEQNFQELFEYLRKANFHFVLIDPETCRQASGPGNVDMAERINALYKAIDEVARERGKNESDKRHRVNGGVILTKADTIPELDNQSPEEFFRKQQPNLDDRLRERFWKMGYLAISATGECMEREAEDGKTRLYPNPQALSPDGYEELFRWMIETDRRKRGYALRIAGAIALTALAVIAIGKFGGDNITLDRYEAILKNPDLTVVQKMLATANAQYPEIVAKRNELFQAELKAIEAEAESAETVITIDQLEKKLESLEEVKPASMEDKVRQCRDRLDQKGQELSFLRIKDAHEGKKPEFGVLADAFLKKYPKGHYADQVRKILEEAGVDIIRNERQKIAAMRVEDASQLRNKVQAIYDFLEKFGQAPQLADFDRQRMRRAADLGKQFSEKNSYEVIVKRSGGLSSRRFQKLDFIMGDISKPSVVSMESSASSKEVTWGENPVRFDWTVAEPIRILFSASKNIILVSGGYERIAGIRDETPVALKIFNGKKPFTVVEPSWLGEVDGPFVECEVKGIAGDDWQAVSDYLFPGDAW